MSAESIHSDYRDVTVIIPQHGYWEQTVACCSSLWRHHGDELSIVVVDDGSPAKDREISKRFLQDKVCWIEQAHSGITAAWNMGIRRCHSRFIVLLNNDAITLSPWLDWGCGYLRSNPCGLVGAAVRHEQMLTEVNCSGQTPDVRLLEGWCLCFERITFEQVGEFDEAMRLYWSDTDWQMRWKKEFGNSSDDFGLIPAGSLRHVGHVSTQQLERRSMRWQEDRTMFLKKWREP